MRIAILVIAYFNFSSLKHLFICGLLVRLKVGIRDVCSLPVFHVDEKFTHQVIPNCLIFFMSRWKFIHQVLSQVHICTSSF